MCYIIRYGIVFFVILFTKAELIGQADVKCYGNGNFEFGIEKERQSIFEVPVFQTFKVQDIDNDGIPEIIAVKNADYIVGAYYLNRDILIINSQTLEVVNEINTYYFAPNYGNFVITGDELGGYEIIVAVADNDENPNHVRGKLVCYRSDGSIKWISDFKYGSGHSDNMFFYRLGGCLSLADFNQDGIPEVYIFNEIFNARTGKKLAYGGKHGLGGLPGITIAADLDDNPNDLELAAGYTIYKVKITNLNGLAGNEMTPYNMRVNGDLLDGYTVVADINGDGRLDVIVTHSRQISMIYVYTLADLQCSFIAKKVFFVERWDILGFPVIGNFTNQSEVGMVLFTRDTLHKLSYIDSELLSEDWRLKIQDNSNYYIFLSAYDFDNDGIHEFIFRGKENLQVFNAKDNTPVMLGGAHCKSAPTHDHAMIADINNIGSARICVPCSDSDKNFKPGHLTIFGPPEGQHWAPARNIWHQFGYNPLFINDDGTVPQHMHNPATYKNGKYNNFNVQENLLDGDGKIPAASLYGDIPCIGYDVDTDSYHVSFTVRNRADASATAKTNVPVAFYTGDPERDGRLIGVYHTTASITAGENTGTLSYSFPASGVTSLWMVVNTDRYPMILSDSSYYSIDECDYTDNVFIAELPKIQRQEQEICEGDTVDFYGQQLSTAGQYHYKLRSATDCDSLIAILDLTVTDKKDEAVTDIACDTYTWNGQTYDRSGDYEYRTTSISGCDSIVTLSLSIHPSIQQTEVQTTCERYEWNGQTYTTSGIFTYNGQTSQGCDSTVTLNLTIHSKAESIQQISVCDSYEWNGQRYDQSGTYTYNGQTKQGCDSTAILELVISTSLTVTEEKTACDQIIINGITLDTSGDYPESYLTSTGCDSTHILRLTIHKSTQSNQAITACEEYDFFGSTKTESGIYRHTLTNQQGCDSLITLDLRIAAEASQAIATACGSYHWAAGDTTITNSGVYTTRYLNQYGCDSTITLSLNIAPEYDIQKQEEACGNFTWSVTKERYTATGIYSQLLKTAQGCDSLITLDLTIHPEFEYHDTVSTTSSYYWPLNGQTYDQSGVYTELFRTEASCDSIHVLHLRVSYNTDIYFPNVITGEGSNGYFTGYSTTKGTQIRSLSVFDRWGNRVFHREHFATNEPEAGWDGKFGGKDVVPGVYIWTAQIVHSDGREETFSGDVTVVR
ncbi:MAG: gliding motility-associated C-terminal domain-containing protein [Chitinophagales bacterium]|nr:gliding motility-associated C-terminal domain-containing protein [Chitinophagales bacterium]